MNIFDTNYYQYLLTKNLLWLFWDLINVLSSCGSVSGDINESCDSGAAGSSGTYVEYS